MSGGPENHVKDYVVQGEWNPFGASERIQKKQKELSDKFKRELEKNKNLTELRDLKKGLEGEISKLEATISELKDPEYIRLRKEEDRTYEPENTFWKEHKLGVLKKHSQLIEKKVKSVEQIEAKAKLETKALSQEVIRLFAKRIKEAGDNIQKLTKIKENIRAIITGGQNLLGTSDEIFSKADLDWLRKMEGELINKIKKIKKLPKKQPKAPAAPKEKVDPKWKKEAQNKIAGEIAKEDSATHEVARGETLGAIISGMKKGRVEGLEGQNIWGLDVIYRFGDQEAEAIKLGSAGKIWKGNEVSVEDGKVIVELKTKKQKESVEKATTWQVIEADKKNVKEDLKFEEKASDLLITQPEDLGEKLKKKKVGVTGQEGLNLPAEAKSGKGDLKIESATRLPLGEKKRNLESATADLNASRTNSADALNIQASASLPKGVTAAPVNAAERAKQTREKLLAEFPVLKNFESNKLKLNKAKGIVTLGNHKFELKGGLLVRNGEQEMPVLPEGWKITDGGADSGVRLKSPENKDFYLYIDPTWETLYQLAKVETQGIDSSSNHLDDSKNSKLKEAIEKVKPNYNLTEDKIIGRLQFIRYEDARSELLKGARQVRDPIDKIETQPKKALDRRGRPSNKEVLVATVYYKAGGKKEHEYPIKDREPATMKTAAIELAKLMNKI